MIILGPSMPASYKTVPERRYMLWARLSPNWHYYKPETNWRFRAVQRQEGPLPDSAFVQKDSLPSTRYRSITTTQPRTQIMLH